MTSYLYPLGVSLGAEVVEVAGLAERHGPVREGLLDRTGFTTIRRAPADVDALDLSNEAISQTADRSWVELVDGVVSVTSTPRLQAPGNAHLLQEQWGLSSQTFGLDVNDACTGFVRSFLVAESLITAGLASTVLLVIADTYTKLYGEQDLRVSPLFSDGASAMLISATPLQITTAFPARRWEVLSSDFQSDGSGAGELSITPRDDAAVGQLFMNGAGVLNFVLGNLRTVLADLAKQSGVPTDEVDQWYVHQGSKMVVDAVGKAVGRSGDELFRSREYGNIVGSSLPAQFFNDAQASERLLGLLGFGVGLTMGGMIVRESPVSQ